MTKEQLKADICEQIDMMDESEVEELGAFLSQKDQDEEVAQELVEIKGEFKKLTKLIQNTQQQIDKKSIDIKREKLESFISFDNDLKNVHDAIDSLPQAKLFNHTRINQSIDALQKGFGTIAKQYGAILEVIGVHRTAQIGEVFDPHLHEAVDVIKDEKIKDGTIVEVLEEGFIYEDEILNYAKVKVNQWT